MNILNLAKTRVKIISQEQFDKFTKNSEGEGTAVMAYNYDNGNVIYVTENSLKMFNKEQILESFIHEIAHNLSIKALINPVTFEEREFHDLIFKAFEQYKYLGKTLNGSGSYGFTNEKEFVAELYSNAEFRKEIQNLDKGFWKKFKDAIRRLFGLPKSLINAPPPLLHQRHSRWLLRPPSASRMRTCMATPNRTSPELIACCWAGRPII